MEGSFQFLRREGNVGAEFEIVILRDVLGLRDSDLHDEVGREIVLSKGVGFVSDLACQNLKETLLLFVEELERLLFGESGHFDVLYLVYIFELGY